MNRILAVAALVMVIASAWLGYAWLTSPQLHAAPELRLQSTSGQTVEVGGDRGHPVLINFWASSCASCMKEIPHLVQLYEELQPSGLQIIGVSVHYDPPLRVMEVIDKKRISYPVVFDLDRSIQKAFGMRRAITPVTILIDNDGQIILFQAGIPAMDKLRQQIMELLPAHSYNQKQERIDAMG